MEIKLLVTLSEQKTAWHGIRFVNQFFTNKDNVKITLLYLIPKSSVAWEGERSYETEIENDQLARQYEANARKAVAGARKEIVRAGFKNENIDTKMQVRKFSKVMDIIQEGATGLYDAVILGHRGASWLEEVFEESVSKKILEEKFNFPIWICRKIGEDRKNILVCVDGSDKSYRVVDHVGYLLKHEKAHDVTLVLVRTPGTFAEKEPEEIFLRAKGILLDNGVPESRIANEIINDGNLKKAILKKAEQGRFAAVAIGQTGVGRGVFKKIFAGSLCNELVKDLGNAALWISN